MEYNIHNALDDLCVIATVDLKILIGGEANEKGFVSEKLFTDDNADVESMAMVNKKLEELCGRNGYLARRNRGRGSIAATELELALPKSRKRQEEEKYSTISTLREALNARNTIVFHMQRAAHVLKFQGVQLHTSSKHIIVPTTKGAESEKETVLCSIRGANKEFDLLGAVGLHPARVKNLYKLELEEEQEDARDAKEYKNKKMLSTSTQERQQEEQDSKNAETVKVEDAAPQRSSSDPLAAHEVNAKSIVPMIPQVFPGGALSQLGLKSTWFIEGTTGADPIESDESSRTVTIREKVQELIGELKQFHINSNTSPASGGISEGGKNARQLVSKLYTTHFVLAPGESTATTEAFANGAIADDGDGPVKKASDSVRAVFGLSALQAQKGGIGAVKGGIREGQGQGADTMDNCFGAHELVQISQELDTLEQKLLNRRSAADSSMLREQKGEGAKTRRLKSELASLRRALKQLALLSQASKTCRSLTNTAALGSTAAESATASTGGDDHSGTVLDSEWDVDTDESSYDADGDEERELNKTNGKHIEADDLNVDRVSNPMFQWKRIREEMERITVASW